MNYTKWLNLKKPLWTDKYSIDVFNENADITDNAIKNIEEQINTIEEQHYTKTEIDELLNNLIISVDELPANPDPNKYYAIRES